MEGSGCARFIQWAVWRLKNLSWQNVCPLPSSLASKGANGALADTLSRRSCFSGVGGALHRGCGVHRMAAEDFQNRSASAKRAGGGEKD